VAIKFSLGCWLFVITCLLLGVTVVSKTYINNIIVDNNMVTITEVLNIWNNLGVFSYVVPFLLIFAVIFAILEKTKVLGINKGIQVIVAFSIGLLSLQFDIVSVFFATIFPRFGVVLAIFLVLLIFLGFFFFKEGANDNKLTWIGWVSGIGLVIWAVSEWNYYGGYGVGNFSWWFQEYFWPLVILVLVVVAVVAAVNYEGKKS
jgi:hypothetical protein